MPLSLADVKAKKRTVEVRLKGAYAGSVLNVTYDPTLQTPNFSAELDRQARERVKEAQAAEASEEGQDGQATSVFEGLIYIITRIVTDWDLIGRDGSPVDPSAPAALRNVPAAVLDQVVGAIGDDAQGKAEPENQTPESSFDAS